MARSPSLALAFATIERPQAVQRLIRSVRKYFPDLPVYVADQSRQGGAMSAFYAANEVNLIRMPYDIGVTASRNRLAQEIKEDYFVLCDDDFIAGRRTSFREAVQILDAEPDLAVIGGRLYDLYSGEEWIRNWELYLEYDVQHKILFSVPIYQLAPRAREVGGIRFYLCDAVLNFAVFRRSIFSSGVGWDERFKSNGEHEDFYLNLKINSPYKVAHLPAMVAYHHHPEEYRAYRAWLRDRNEGWKRFFEKWGLEQHVEFGLGVRTIDDFGAVIEAGDAQSRFFVNAGLSLSRRAPAPDTLLVGDHVKIATVGALDEWGDLTQPDATAGSLLLDRASRQIIAAPGTAPARQARPAVALPLSDEGIERYQLEAEAGDRALGFINEGFYFRYDPVLRDDTDFVLWYTRDPAQADDNGSGQRLSAVVRWTSSDGSSLVWKSPRKYLDLEPAPYWRPLLLDVPLLPRGSRWLRFDMVTDGGPSADPVCTGFLFAASDVMSSLPARKLEALNLEVLALSRLANDGAAPGRNGRPLAEVSRNCAELPVTMRRAVPDADLMVLRIDEASALEVVFFVGWESLGRSLISARLPGPLLQAPAAIAVPSATWRSQRGPILGFGSAKGLVVLAAAEEDAPALQ
jgi:hypothetical protein